MENDALVPLLRSAWPDTISWRFGMGGQWRVGGGWVGTSSQRLILQRFGVRCKRRCAGMPLRMADLYRLVRQRPNVRFDFSEKWRKSLWLERGEADRVVSTAERFYVMRRQTITLIEYEHTRNGIQVEFLEDSDDGCNLHVDIRRTGVHDVEQ